MTGLDSALGTAAVWLLVPLFALMVILAWVFLATRAKRSASLTVSGLGLRIEMKTGPEITNEADEK